MLYLKLGRANLIAYNTDIIAYGLRGRAMESPPLASKWHKNDTRIAQRVDVVTYHNTLSFEVSDHHGSSHMCVAIRLKRTVVARDRILFAHEA